ncbi:MAG: hypothetical protein PHE17_00570 [Thiothrix sp.]|uniref:hypothetical protein n=1 Tax=Thiothrix sp. TaxID=1032 RepID=UPI0026177783|nr:hypothetical protein [Thiothrix sp.]MDD5391486.1 hypothetical protein [Thiothrix sp.]
MTMVAVTITMDIVGYYLNAKKHSPRRTGAVNTGKSYYYWYLLLLLACLASLLTFFLFRKETDAPCGQGVSLGEQQLIVIDMLWLLSTLLGLAETCCKTTGLPV